MSKASVQQILSDSKTMRPMCHRQSQAVVGQSLTETKLSPVVRLDLPRRPSTIPLRVGAVIVDPVNRVCRGRFMTHIAVERLKGRKPLSTHDDSSPAVVFERLVLWAAASGSHRNPRSIFGRTISLTRTSVFSVTSLSHFSGNTSARLACTIPQCARLNPSLSAAIAATRDVGRATRCYSAYRAFENKPAAKTPSGHHGRCRIVTHRGFISVVPRSRPFTAARGHSDALILPRLTGLIP